MQNQDVLFTPLQLGKVDLSNRMVMAPLTRSRSKQPGDIPWSLNIEYYRQRASAGLIICEATQISPQGKGYAFTPGIYSQEQIDGWKAITNAVHEEGAKIFSQLWHVGRVSHTEVQPNGELPVAPSAIKIEGQAFTEKGLLDFELPRALETEEIPGIIEQYSQAAINAKEAGFDGIEVHAGNGYLLDQFLRDCSNRRTDKYGGSIESRMRLLLEVLDAVIKVWGEGRVGVRLSPTGGFNSMSDSAPQAHFNAIVEGINQYPLAYIHLVEEFMVEDEAVTFDFSQLRERFDGAYIANGGYDAQKARNSLNKQSSDLVAFGQLYIANPDLVERFKQGAELNPLDPNTLYGGGSKGYTDYPALAGA